MCMGSGRDRVGVAVEVLECKCCATELPTILLGYNRYKTGFVVVVTPERIEVTMAVKRQ